MILSNVLTCMSTYHSGIWEKLCMQSSWSTSALLCWGCTSPSSSALSQLECLCSVEWSLHSCTTSSWLCSSGWQLKPYSCIGSWCLCSNQILKTMSSSPWQYAGVRWYEEHTECCQWLDSVPCATMLFLYVPHSPYSCSCIHCSLLLSSILPELHPRGIVRSNGNTA